MSCTPLAAYALRTYAAGTALPAVERDRTSDAHRTSGAERATPRGPCAPNAQRPNVRPTPLHGTSTRDPHRDQSRIVRSPGDVVCESPERASASRLSRL